jgi:hypothetical protein
MLTFTQRLLVRVAASAVLLPILHAAPVGFPTIAASRVAPNPDSIMLYVSPDGNDGWSGSLPKPNADKTDGPFATIKKARDRIIQLKALGGLRQPITVLLRGGVYEQRQTMVFTPDDSGTKACPITFQAYPGEVPVISGGRAIGGWQSDGKLWRASVPKTPDGTVWRFNQLVVDGQRRTRARIPNRGSFLRTDGPISKDNKRGFRFQRGDLKRWKNLRDVIVVVYHSWETSIHHIRSLDTDYGEVIFREPAPWPMGRWEKRQRYYVENVFEGLDEPGEWYLDARKATLYYYPMPGEKMNEIHAVAPLVTSTLVQFKGDPAKGKFVDFLNFRGISFQHTDAELVRLRNPGQGEIYQPGLIQAVGLRGSTFESCEIAHSGAHGIWLAAGSCYNRVERCHIHDLCGGGVYVGTTSVDKKAPTGHSLVDNNFIHDAGYLFHGAHGVWIGRSSYNKVTHNEISNLDYSGISCGWSWGFAATTANHNNLDYNHIHHLSNGEGLSDMGGIYTLGVSPGTTERFNHIHDVHNYAYVSHGSGIYPDEGSTGIAIENNVVYWVSTCPLFMHYGKECIVRNNILALGGKGELRRSREDKRCHYVAERNIVYGDKRELLDGPWKNGDWKLGHNLYWSTAGEPTFAGMDFATWQKKGKDEGSIVADPLFVDPEHGDFSLRRGSPAIKVGFIPINLSSTGLYGDKGWTSLPSRYPNRALNHVPKPVEPPFIVNFDFEGEDAGKEPLDGHVVCQGKNSALIVSADTAASGKQSLKFVDEKDAPASWMPHIYYKKTYSTGTVHLSWDMLNSKQAPASFYVEVRQYANGSKYSVGPTVSVSSDGQVTASGKSVGTLPAGEWGHVDITLHLGQGAPLVYDLTYSAPGQPTKTATFPYKDDTFREIQWLGISSTSDAPTVFYIDNLKMGTAEDLAKPVVRKARRPARVRPKGPGNKQKLMGYWKFDEGEGYIAEDSSGYGNDGEVWARWAKGAFGSAIYCDSVDNAVSIADNETLQLGTDDFAIELWLCPTQLSIDSKDKRRRFLSKNGYPTSWLTMDISEQGLVKLEMIDTNRQSGSTQAKGKIRENAWTHLAVVVNRKRGDICYYINGVLDSMHAIPEKFGDISVKGKELTIGSTWQPFIGLLDEVKIYRRPLSAQEIETEYAKGKGTRTSAKFQLVE